MKNERIIFIANNIENRHECGLTDEEFEMLRNASEGVPHTIDFLTIVKKNILSNINPVEND